MILASTAGRPRQRPRLVPALSLDPEKALAGALAATLPSGSVAGMEALAAAILNRARADGGPDAVTRTSIAATGGPPRDPRLLDVAGRIARRALAGLLEDPTRGATLWHDEREDPDWARSMAPVHAIGGLVFYRPSAPQNFSSPQTRTGSGKSR